jgi:hypothetical protein
VDPYQGNLGVSRSRLGVGVGLTFVNPPRYAFATSGLHMSVRNPYLGREMGMKHVLGQAAAGRVPHSAGRRARRLRNTVNVALRV